MRTKWIGLALLLCSFLSMTASAAPPQIGGISPLGVQRGVPIEVSISGSSLVGNPRLIAPFGFRIEQPAAKSDATNWRIKLVIGAETAVGVYPIRVQTDDGISNPFLFAVGQLPQVPEKEENSTFETAQPIPEPPLVVEGSVAGNDVDFYRFRGRKGQRIVVDAQCARIGSGLDPTIRLTTAAANRTFIASADDTPGLLTDARLTAVLPEDTEYVVEIADTRYQGASRPVYRLLIGAVPMADEIFPLGGRIGETTGLELRGGTLPATEIAAAMLTTPFGTNIFQPRVSECMLGLPTTGGRNLDLESLPPLVVSSYPELRETNESESSPARAVTPVVFNGRIDPAGDEDRFKVVVTPGSRLRIKVHAYDLGSALDGVLRVEGNNGSVIGNADDTTVNLPPKNNQPQSIIIPDPTLDMTVPGGTNEITIVIRDLERRGGVGFPYRIVVEPLTPDFDLQFDEPQASIPKGGTAIVALTVSRRGYNGPINVTAPTLPAGLTMRPGTIAAGQNIGVFSLTATADAHFSAAPLKILARGEVSGAQIEEIAFKNIVHAQQSSLPTNTTAQFGLMVAPALATPVTLDSPTTPIEVAHGFGATIPIKATRTPGSEGVLAITALPPPTGLTVPGDPIAAKANEGTVRVQAALEAAIGTSTLALQAKGKIRNADQTIAIPTVTLNVVRPANLVMSSANLEVKAGSTTELKGKVIRKGTFNDPVNVRINGLPAGLKADPITVAPGITDFALKVVADPKAAAASAGAEVKLAFQVQKKDYSVPATPLTVKVLASK